MMTNPTFHSRRLASIIGLAVGDAVGTTVEFMPAGTFTPLTDMVGGGPFGLPAGAWTDDTSMAMCLAESLVECAGFDAADQMRRYLRWWREGYWSSTDRCFDIGNTTSAALRRFELTGEPIAGSVDSATAGNGSVMRLAPVVAWAAADSAQAVHLARESSRTTHGAADCIDGCELLARLLLAGYQGGDVRDPLDGPIPQGWSDWLRKVAAMGTDVADQPPCGPTGYVVDTIACARWAVARARDFREAILLAANLGGDADTIAAVAGQLAGAQWGMEGIPMDWIERLARRDEVMQLAERVVA